MTVQTPSQLSHSAIRDYAEKVGEHHAIYSEEGRADLERLVENLQMTVKYSDSNPSSSIESSEVDDEKRMTIYLPTMTSSRRDRFTIAHEIAHFFLHYLHAGHQGRMSFGRGESNRAETQANVFASSLLMPESQFRSAHRELNGDPDLLAIRFGVSPVAARVRSSVLSLG